MYLWNFDFILSSYQKKFVFQNYGIYRSLKKCFIYYTL